VEIFIGGGGDDLAFLNLGVVADYARRYAAETGRRVLYVPNARIRTVRDAIRAAARAGERVSLIGHSWGGPDAWRAAAWAARDGLPVARLITLDPVGGPLPRRFEAPLPAPWLNVEAQPSTPDRSDWLTSLRPYARKPSPLPVALATRHVALDLNHRDVAGMMRLSGARRWLDGGALSPMAQAGAPSGLAKP
jgi:pimeloyl-ACP methyl ester carboxylesterase